MIAEDRSLLEWAENFQPEKNELQVDNAHHIVDLKKYLDVCALRMRTFENVPSMFGIYRSQLQRVKDRLEKGE